MLHASNRTGNSLVEKWKDLAKKKGFIIVGPDSQNLKGWWAPQDGPEYLRDVVEGLKKKYPIDPRRYISVWPFRGRKLCNCDVLTGVAVFCCDSGPRWSDWLKMILPGWNWRSGRFRFLFKWGSTMSFSRLIRLG